MYYHEKTENRLLYNIEQCRKKMHKLSSHFSYQSQEVILISQELDMLLNEYESLKKESRN
ncbi:aspartyl-phosphate phosphatase Spo0E family protein [Calidifontibacillus oryziterrae]|uniref:aspartyl-phosphate phosphatase Spo0E family protein n=1 Tax=Calidifontibacillus oryziterrae TaxID=1191699 RepID=UPI00030A126F|nr:aspartyl-phosphate phosphatase Spo0E family protein [Calidifontibacillus oryziterrae]